MKYIMKSGGLYTEQPSAPLARIKSNLVGPVKKIYLREDMPVMKTDICNNADTEKSRGDVRNRIYTLTNRDGHKIAEAYPDYADGEDPNVMGWPICRLPRVDHARIIIHDSNYMLTMHNSQNYSLLDKNNYEVLRIMHRGIAGGWVLDDQNGFTPEVLCGLFIFCRYVEQENELLIV